MRAFVNRLVRGGVVAITLSAVAQAQTAVAPPGAGSVESPYQISQLGHLVWMAENVGDSDGQHYVLQNNLNAAATSGWNGGEGFAPIGGNLQPRFRGVFDGNGNVISNLSIHRPNQGQLGLFGEIDDGAEVKNIGLANMSIAGSNEVGCLVGWNQGSVNGCYATGSVVVGHNYLGGLVGWNDGIVSGSYAVVSVTGNTHIGGLVGLNYDSAAIADCQTSGSVSGSNFVGGLVGWNDSEVSQCRAMNSVLGAYAVGGLLGMNWTGAVERCLAAGVVAGGHGVGGLMGENWTGAVTKCYAVALVSGERDVGGLMGENGGFISSCYAMGTVMGEDHEAGGLVGWNYGGIGESYAACAVTGGSDLGGLVGWNDGAVDNSYWDTQISGLATSAGGSGKTTAQMKQPATFTGWNFATIWGIVENETYPYLMDFGPDMVPVPSLTPMERAVGQADGTTTFSVANIGGGTLVYSASESETWLSIASGGSGTNSGTIVVSYLANTNAQARTGAITVSGGGFSGICLVHQMGTALPYAGILESVLAPASMSTGQAYSVTTTVRNAGTNRWTAAIVGSSYYPSYKIIFRNMSWTNSGDQYIQQMMLHVQAGATHAHSTTLDVSRLPPGSYSYVMDCKYHNTEWTDSYVAMSNSPRTNTFVIAAPPVVLPGTVEMENFNYGGQGMGYNDTTATNEGGQYRPGEGVDISADAGAGNGYVVGWTKAGEWLEYTVNVSSSGTYTLETRVAGVGAGGQFRILVNGVDQTGLLNVPNTGAWNVYQVVQKHDVNMFSGIQTVRVSMVTEGSSTYVGAFDHWRSTYTGPMFAFSQALVASGTNRILAWERYANGIRIQHTPSLMPATWSNLTDWITGNQYAIPSDNLKTTGFYRLEYQP